METIQSKIQSTPVLFVLLAAFWGTSFVAIDVGLERVPPLLFAALRYDLAGVVVLAYAAVTHDRWLPRTRRDWLSALVGGVFLVGAFHALLYLGQGAVSGAVAAIVVSLVPLLTAVFDHTLLGERRLEPIGGAGFVFGVVGVVVVANPTPGALDSTAALGIGLVFLSAVAFALGSVATRSVSADFPVVSQQAWTMLVGAAVLHLGSVVRGESFVASAWTPSVLLSFGYLAVVSGVVGFLIYFELLERVGPSELNLVNYLNPIVAALVSWAVLGEVLGTTAVAGFVVIFAGFGLLKRDAVRCLVRSQWTVADC
ncbi:DMT family transporter [Salinigranum halophilum]|uniref:DMT family transporter n=1 Tax=Salinigranum halophilum TaxID=2565931 RepID=UPI0010A93851|nr:EamA family transporter [Salinigranum halophilum]